ncbi:MAG: glycosyltransferase family 39 protein [Alphaproteobacteria bacterium]|nr:glycosyltransferase family 39 protein [Alphaproteobacteria bacterium]
MVVGVLAITLIFLALRGYDASQRTLISHDSAITILSATGNQIAFGSLDAMGLTDRWVDMAAFGFLRDPAPGLDFAAVREGLVLSDIHPPLYFYALHLWQALFGQAFSTLLYLNVLIGAACVVATGVLSRMILGQTTTALIATAFFAASPFFLGPVQGVLRQYELLQFCTALSAIGWVGFLKSETRGARWRYLALIVAAQTAGLLTQIQFVFIIASACLAALLIRELRPRGFLMLTGAAIASGLAFLALHPEIFDQIARQQSQVHDVSTADAVARALRVSRSFLEVFGLSRPASDPIAAMGLGLLLFGLLLWLGLRVARRWRGLGIAPWAAFLCLTAAIAVAGSIAQFALYLVPQHAMGGRYFLLFWPLAAVAFVAALTSLSRGISTAVLGLAALAILTENAWRVAEAQATYRYGNEVTQTVAGARAIYTDTTARGLLPRVVLSASPDAQIYIDTKNGTAETLGALLEAQPEIDLFITTTFYKPDASIVFQRRAMIEEKHGSALTTRRTLGLRYQSVKTED